MRVEIDALKTKPLVVIDEVQKVPKILDEVHWLHEAHGLQFALCGSSTRKVKRGAANLPVFSEFLRKRGWVRRLWMVCMCHAQS